MLYFKKNKDLYRVAEEEILYIQQSKRDVLFVTEKGEFCLKCRKISSLEEHFDKDFLKCHSYILVNLNKVEIVGQMEVILQGDISVGMCKAATNKLKRALKERSFIENKK